MSYYQVATQSPKWINAFGFNPSIVNKKAFAKKKQTFSPQYNIEKKSDSEFYVSLALAGYKQSWLDVSIQDQTLTVKADVESQKLETTYLHHGLAIKSFSKQFDLPPHMKVESATFEHGLLSIHIQQELPEHLKPQSIDINVN